MTPHENTCTLPTDFDALLRRWNDHQKLRSARASISELSRSRWELDQLRLAQYC